MSGDLPKHPPMDLPGTGTEMVALCESMRRYNNAMYDVYLAFAHDLEQGLRNSEGGNPLLFGLDKWAAAKRVTRPLKKAAEEHRRIAQAWIACKLGFSEHFQPAGKGRHAARRGINVNR